MTDFTSKIDYVTPVVDFINTCPILDLYGIENADVVGIEQLTTDGNIVISYGGTSIVSSGTKKDIYGNSVTTRQLDHIIQFYLDKTANIDRKNNQNFLFHFEKWVEYQNYLNNNCQSGEVLPKLGDDVSTVSWTADNGYYVEPVVEGGQTDTALGFYQILLHIVFYREYEEE